MNTVLSALNILGGLVARLLPYAPEVEELIALFEAGNDRAAIMKAARDAAVIASDEAMKKAAGLPL